MMQCVVQCNVCVMQCNKWKHLLQSSVLTQQAEAAAEANNGADSQLSRRDASRILCG